MNNPSVYVLTPLTDDCKQWIADNVVYESWQLIGEGIAIEWRYIDELIALLTESEYILGVDFTVRS